MDDRHKALLLDLINRESRVSPPYTSLEFALNQTSVSWLNNILTMEVWAMLKDLQAQHGKSDG